MNDKPLTWFLLGAAWATLVYSIVQIVRAA
jgi:hypothetical protein